MSSDFIPHKDYKLISFTKEEKNIVKRIKEYANRNCRKVIQKSFITKSLNELDYGFAYFRTEILKFDQSVKIRPCAFACVKKEKNNILNLLLICTIQNMDKLGTKLLNNVFEYAKENKFIKIFLECNESNIDFYTKFDFINEGFTNDELFIMVKHVQ
jgi:hypothetical protein